MKYRQKVSLKNIDYLNVVTAFHNISFVQYLIQWQPVKLIFWDGIYNNNKAHFKFWFIVWHDFKVKHKLFNCDSNMLFFEDTGTKLPLGLSDWKHKHIVKRNINDVLITDEVYFKHKSKILGFLLYPIFIFPILLRRILYNQYFQNGVKNDK
tara:strand:+ start:49 stop:504 length:456 start_codon:yes stop_codon:yes gene_type:complete